jgi:hypothetical protein
MGERIRSTNGSKKLEARLGNDRVRGSSSVYRRHGRLTMDFCSWSREKHPFTVADALGRPGHHGHEARTRTTDTIRVMKGGE